MTNTLLWNSEPLSAAGEALEALESLVRRSP